jgi:tetratricopeptide (TPR) repeat protein
MKRWLVAGVLAALPVAAAAPPKVTTADQQLKDATAKEAAGNFDGAAEVLRQLAASADPLAGEAGLRLGKMFEARFELRNAVDAYTGAAEKLTGGPKGEALGRLAVAQDLLGLQGAAGNAEAAMAADATGLWPTLAMARIRAAQGKGDEALALADQAAAAGGGAVAGAARGYALEAKGDLAAAEAAYRAALAVDGKQVTATLGLARLLRQTGRAAEALPLVQHVTDSAPGAVEAYKESARIKLALGQTDDAFADANIAAALSDNDKGAQRLVAETKVAQAAALVGKGQPELAVQDLVAMRDQQPDEAVVRIGLAKAYIAQRQGSLAVAELSKAVELDPALTEGQYLLGFALLNLKGDAAAALPPLERAAAAEPNNLQYALQRGIALNALQQFDRAVPVLLKVTQDPRNQDPEAHIALGQAYVGQKAYKDALPVLVKATEMAPQNDRAFAFLAWAQFGLKDAEAFKRAGAKARSLGYKEPTLLKYLARIEGGEKIK